MSARRLLSSRVKKLQSPLPRNARARLPLAEPRRLLSLFLLSHSTDSLFAPRQSKKKKARALLLPAPPTVVLSTRSVSGVAERPLTGSVRGGPCVGLPGCLLRNPAVPSLESAHSTLGAAQLSRSQVVCSMLSRWSDLFAICHDG